MNPEVSNNGVNNDNGVPEESTHQAVNQTDSKNNSPKKGRLWIKVLIIIVLIIIAVTALGYVMLFISFSGGIQNVISNSKSAPDTNSPAFIDRKNQVRGNIQKLFTNIESITGLKPYGSVSKDRCDEGQNNYKVSDGYAHQCIYRISTFYGINDDFRQKMLDFEKQILSDGWKDTGSLGCTHCTISGVITNYYDDPERAQGNPLYLPPEPGAYTKDGNKLDIMYEYKKYALQDDSFGYSMSVGDIQQQKDFRDGLVAVLNSNKIVFVVSIEKVFFQN